MRFNYALLCIVGSVLLLLPLMEVLGHSCPVAVEFVACVAIVFLAIVGLASLFFADSLRGVSLVELTESEYKVVGNNGRFGLYLFHENRIDVLAKVEYETISEVGRDVYEFLLRGKKSLLYLGGDAPVWVHDIDGNGTSVDEKYLYIVEKVNAPRR